MTTFMIAVAAMTVGHLLARAAGGRGGSQPESEALAPTNWCSLDWIYLADQRALPSDLYQKLASVAA